MTWMTPFSHSMSVFTTFALSTFTFLPLAASYLLAILEGDRRRASKLILAAADEGKNVADLYQNVLQ